MEFLSLIHIYNVVRRNVKQAFFQRTVTAVRNIFFDGFRVNLSAVFQYDSFLVLIERDFLLHRVSNAVSGINQTINHLIFDNRLFYDFFAVIQ